MKKIETIRLLLRQLKVSDVSDKYIKALNDKEIITLTEARYRKWTRSKVIDYVKNSNNPKSSLLIGLFVKKPFKHIGNIRLSGYNLRHKRVDLGIMIFDKTEWGKGYATEALIGVENYVFGQLQFYKICADYYSVNKASEKIFKKAGYVIEGVFKDHFLLDGKYVDSVRISKINKTRKHYEK